MIIDEHAHAFPDQRGPCGHPSVRDFHLTRQIHRVGYTERVRRVSDNAPVKEDTLWDGKNPGVRGLVEVNWRISPFGRYEWTRDGVDYYTQWMPALLEPPHHPPETLIAQMDHAGVDRAVLHNSKGYGILNDYLAECARKYPARLVVSAQVPESRAHQEDQIRELRRCVKELGLVALHFQVEGLFMVDHRYHLDDEILAPFWEEVAALGIPVLWNIRPVSIPRPWSYVDQIRRVGVWARRYSGNQGVFTHGFNCRYFTDSNGRITIPEEVMEVLALPNMLFEALFPVMMRKVEYPYPEAQEVLRFLYRRLGASKIMWGSDMPCTEVSCTYQQSLDYLRKHCTFISPSDMDLILGGNAATLYPFASA